jgi:hypothetical protein
MDKREIIMEIKLRGNHDHNVGIICKNNVDVDYCESFNKGKGCMYISNCMYYKEVKNEK